MIKELGPYNVFIDAGDGKLKNLYFSYEALMNCVGKEYFVTISEEPDVTRDHRHIKSNEICASFKLEQYHKREDGLYLIGTTKPIGEKSWQLAAMMEEDPDSVSFRIRGHSNPVLTGEGNILHKMIDVVSIDCCKE